MSANQPDVWLILVAYTCRSIYTHQVKAALILCNVVIAVYTCGLAVVDSGRGRVEQNYISVPDHNLQHGMKELCDSLSMQVRI